MGLAAPFEDLIETQNFSQRAACRVHWITIDRVDQSQSLSAHD